MRHAPWYVQRGAVFSFLDFHINMRCNSSQISLGLIPSRTAFSCNELTYRVARRGLPLLEEFSFLFLCHMALFPLQRHHPISY